MNRVPTRHGHYTGYNRGCRCDLCAEAHRDRMREYVKQPDQLVKQRVRAKRYRDRVRRMSTS